MITRKKRCKWEGDKKTGTSRKKRKKEKNGI
jgi:hypothetical protein